MPFIHIRITDEHVSTQQKEQLIVGVNQLMQDILDKDPSTTMTIIDEVNLDNWGIGPNTVRSLRERTEIEPDTAHSSEEIKSTNTYNQHS